MKGVRRTVESVCPFYFLLGVDMNISKVLLDTWTVEKCQPLSIKNLGISVETIDIDHSAFNESTGRNVDMQTACL